MAGHSQFKNIMHKKGKQDAIRSKLFSKLAREITVAAKMGLHQDRDEQELAAPVVSLSLGDAALFRLGGPERGGPTRSLRLQSGDAIAFGGPARLAFHGIDRIVTGSSTLLATGGRINLTMRRVTPAD